MALEIFRAISNLRMVLDSETDYDSPDNETTYKAMREMIEILFQLMLDTGVSGTATSDPPDDATGYFYDTNESWTDDLHNGRTLVICSGNAKGNFYTIDDTDDANARLDCTGDNLYSDGVRSGDDYKILYDIKVNTDGHDHDGVNSKSAVLADDTIVQSKIKTAWVESSYDINISGTHSFDPPGGEFGFSSFKVKGETTDVDFDGWSTGAVTTGYAYAQLKFTNNDAGNKRMGYIEQKYITAS